MTWRKSWVICIKSASPWLWLHVIQLPFCLCGTRKRMLTWLTTDGGTTWHPHQQLSPRIFIQESGLPTKPKFTHSPWFSHHFHSKLSQKPIRPSNRAPPCHISTWATGILSWVNWSVQQEPCWYVDTHIPCSSIGSRTIYTCFELSVYNTVVYIYVYIHTLCINHHHISFNLRAEKVNKGCGWDAWRRSCQQW